MPLWSPLWAHLAMDPALPVDSTAQAQAPRMSRAGWTHIRRSGRRRVASPTPRSVAPRVGEPRVVPLEDHGVAAHLQQPRVRARADVVAEIGDVGGEDDRALVLVAAVDDGVELLRPPLVLPPHGEAVEVQEVGAGEPVEQAEVGLL